MQNTFKTLLALAAFSSLPFTSAYATDAIPASYTGSGSSDLVVKGVTVGEVMVNGKPQKSQLKWTYGPVVFNGKFCANLHYVTFEFNTMSYAGWDPVSGFGGTRGGDFTDRGYWEGNIANIPALAQRWITSGASPMIGNTYTCKSPAELNPPPPVATPPVVVTPPPAPVATGPVIPSSYTGGASEAFGTAGAQLSWSYGPVVFSNKFCSNLHYLIFELKTTKAFQTSATNQFAANSVYTAKGYWSGSLADVPNMARNWVKNAGASSLFIGNNYTCQ